MPPAAQSAQYLLDVKVRKEESTTFFKKNKIWYHGDNQIFNIQFIDSQKNLLKGSPSISSRHLPLHPARRRQGGEMGQHEVDPG